MPRDDDEDTELAIPDEECQDYQTGFLHGITAGVCVMAVCGGFWFAVYVLIFG